MGKPIRNTFPGACIGHQLFGSEPIANFFYLHAAVFEIPKEHFTIKPTVC